jgi:threonine dehydrogenase-like Zn-dependent dehydrogenase
MCWNRRDTHSECERCSTRRDGWFCWSTTWKRAGSHATEVFQNIGLRGVLAPARAYLPELLNEVLEGRLNPSPILDLSVSLDEVAAGYVAMDQRQAIKVMVLP